MTLAPSLFLSALLLGFFGSIHCLAMCGGIAGALGQGATPNAPAVRQWTHAFLYSAGRIASYGVAGGIAGGLGEAFAAQTGLTILLRGGAGLLVILCGLHVAGWWNGLATIERMGFRFWRRISPLSQRIGRPEQIWQVVALGMLWGWLPCGLVYSALVGAAASGRPDGGAAFMICFGLGTLPALVPATALSGELRRFLARRSARGVAGAVLIGFGLWCITGALMSHPNHEMHVEGMSVPNHGSHETHGALHPRSPLASPAPTHHLTP